MSLQCRTLIAVRSHRSVRQPIWMSGLKTVKFLHSTYDLLRSCLAVQTPCVYIPSVLPSPTEVSAVLKCLSYFYTVRWSIPYNMVSRKHEFLAGGLRKSRTKGVYEFIHTRSIFFKQIWVKFDTGSLHIIPLRICEYRETRCSESHTSLRVVGEIFPIWYACQVWVKFGTADVQKYIRVLNDCEFRKTSAVKTMLCLGAQFNFFPAFQKCCLRWVKFTIVLTSVSLMHMDTDRPYC